MSGLERCGKEQSPSQSLGVPGRILRIHMMTHEVLDELREVQLDDATRLRLAGVYDETVRELAEVLPVAMREEFGRLVPRLGGTGAPSVAELRVADAQLAGWLDALVNAMDASVVLRALADPDRLAETGAESAAAQRGDVDGYAGTPYR
jgi:hypothetical protein